MSDQPPQIADRLREEVYELADSLLRGTITDDGAAAEATGPPDAEARRHYARFTYDSVKLCQWGSDIAAAADERGDECRAIDGQEANVAERGGWRDARRAAAPALPIHRSSFSSILRFSAGFCFPTWSCVAPRHRCRCRPELRRGGKQSSRDGRYHSDGRSAAVTKVVAKAERVSRHGYWREQLRMARLQRAGQLCRGRQVRNWFPACSKSPTARA